MAILQVLGSDKALRLNNYSLLNLVSSFDWSPNFNAADVFEMGNTSKLDTATELETSGSFSLTSCGNTAGLLARMAVNRDGSNNFLGFTYDASVGGGSGASKGRNAYTFTQDDLTEMRFDLIMHEKPNQKTFSRSLYLPGAFLTGISGRVDTQGLATETYNFAGSFVVGLNDPYHDVQSVPATRTTATTATLIDNTIASTTYTLAFLFVDGKPITNITTDATYATLGASGLVTITTTEGYAIPTGAIIQALVYKTVPGTSFPTAQSTERFQSSGGSVINYVRGSAANVYLAPMDAGSPLATEKWLRVQNLDWNIDLRLDTLRQIEQNNQGSSIYARVPTLPLSVSCNVSVTETDWADWKKLITHDATMNPTGKTFTGSNVHQYTYDLNALAPEFAVVIKYYSKAQTLIQDTRFLDMRVDGMGVRQSIGGRGEVSWSLRGSECRFQGFNP